MFGESFFLPFQTGVSDTYRFRSNRSVELVRSVAIWSDLAVVLGESLRRGAKGEEGGRDKAQAD